MQLKDNILKHMLDDSMLVQKNGLACVQACGDCWGISCQNGRAARESCDVDEDLDEYDGWAIIWKIIIVEFAFAFIFHYFWVMEVEFLFILVWRVWTV